MPSFNIAEFIANFSCLDDIKKTAGTITKDLLAYYHGDEPGQIPGILPGPPGSHAGGYYWFQGANLWSTLIDYWHYTGDSSHNDLIAQGLLAQRGENNNYLPANFSASIGNDDQADWALAALLAAERGFPNPPSDKPKWVDMSVNVFNDMVARWDTKTCQGGLRWQIFTTNKGYDVKLCKSPIFSSFSSLYATEENHTLTATQAAPTLASLTSQPD